MSSRATARELTVRWEDPGCCTLAARTAASDAKLTQESTSKLLAHAKTTCSILS